MAGSARLTRLIIGVIWSSSRGDDLLSCWQACCTPLHTLTHTHTPSFTPPFLQPTQHSGFDRHETAPLLRSLLSSHFSSYRLKHACKQVRVYFKSSMNTRHVHKFIHAPHLCMAAQTHPQYSRTHVQNAQFSRNLHVSHRSSFVFSTRL